MIYQHLVSKKLFFHEIYFFALMFSIFDALFTKNIEYWWYVTKKSRFFTTKRFSLIFWRVKKNITPRGTRKLCKNVGKMHVLIMSRQTWCVKKNIKDMVPQNPLKSLENNVSALRRLSFAGQEKHKTTARPPKTNGNYGKSLIFAGSTLSDRRANQDAFERQ